MGKAVVVWDTAGNSISVMRGLDGITNEGFTFWNITQLLGGGAGLGGAFKAGLRIKVDPNALGMNLGQLQFKFADDLVEGIEDAAQKLDDVPPVPGIQANKSAGDTIRDAIAAREAPALIEQSYSTVGGIRRIDVLKLGDELLGIESKVGRTSLDSRVRQELARDWWLLRQGKLDRIRWEFSPSEVTGKVGPTKQLLEKLLGLGFDIIINF